MSHMWMDPFGRFAEMADTADMTLPVRCRWCSRVYDLGKVTVTGRYTDCSMWKAPCCGVTADDRKPPWGVSHYTELPRRDQAFFVADEDVTFPAEPVPPQQEEG